MKLKRLSAAALAVLAVSAIMGSGVAQASTTISEGGSTLIYPLAFDWSQAYQAITLNKVTTAAVGSGAGITGVCTNPSAPTYDIGASDAPLGYPGVKACTPSSGNLNQFVEVPWALSATGLLYHIQMPNGSWLGSGLNLTADDIVNIYTGKYTKWSQIPSPTQTNTELVAIHHKKRVWRFRKVHGKKRWIWKKHRKRVHGKVRSVFVKHHGHKVHATKIKRWTTSKNETVTHSITLPSTAITPVYRSDGSGDSYAFTNFMSRANSSWNSAYGPTTSFPTGADASAVGSSGNAGVSNSVINTSGGIGYVSVYYLITTLGNFKNVGVAQVKNADGKFEFPNTANIAEAAKSVSAPPAQNTSCTNSDPNPTSDCFGMVIQYPSASYTNAYPISTYTYAIVPKSGLGSSVAPVVKDFLTYAVSNSFHSQPGGLTTGNSIGYVQLPQQVINYCLGVINSITN